MNDFNYDNEIIEVNEETKNISLEELIKMEAEKQESEPPKKEKKKKVKKELSKKQKITIIVITIILVLIIIGIVLFFILKDNDNNEEKPKEPVVIIEKDNYRYENGTLVFLDKNEKEIGNYECENKDTNKCYVTKIDLSNDTIDRVTNVYEDGTEIIKNSKIYYDKYVFVNDGELIYLYNMDTKEKELEFNSIKVYNTDRDLIVVENDNSLYGLLEITSEGYEYIIRCSYNNLVMVNSELLLLLAQDKDKNYIINIDGKKLSDNIKIDVKSANGDYIVGYSNDTYNLYNYESEELLSDYDYISLHDGVIALVKSKRLYLVDNNLSELYEDGIRLTNTDYNKKYVYNEDNRLIETKKSYEIELKDNTVKISIDNDTKEVNILEGMLSSTFSYMSYFDGKLYFYGDEEKTDVIGTYTCTNINKINSIEDGLTNCNLYTTEAGISGIYNNEYVFIYEVDENNNVLYYLYNLKEKKNKGTYSEIKIVNDKELSTNIKPIYTSSSYIIAKSATGSNKGNYGVLEINSEKVQGKIGFKYQSITKESNYYLLQSVDNTYSIYNNTFSKISNEFSYIKLFDKYYVGINNNKLNVYSYNNTLGVLESDIAVTNNEFEIDFTNGFEITINNVKHNYDKNGKKIVNNVVEQPNTENENNTNNDSEGENNEE